MIVSPVEPSILTTDEAVQVTVAFDTTTDGGRSWAAGPTVQADAPTGLGGAAGGAGSIVAGPAVAVGSPNNWWILGVRATGQVYVEVTDDAGVHWATAPGKGLPVLDVTADRAHGDSAPGAITVVDAQVALARVNTTEFVTTDAGADWTPLTRDTL